MITNTSILQKCAKTEYFQIYYFMVIVDYIGKWGRKVKTV